MTAAKCHVHTHLAYGGGPCGAWLDSAEPGGCPERYRHYDYQPAKDSEADKDRRRWAALKETQR